MSNELNDAYTKHICTSQGYESRLEQMLFDPKSDFDFFNIVTMC